MKEKIEKLLLKYELELGELLLFHRQAQDDIKIMDQNSGKIDIYNEVISDLYKVL